MYSLSVNIKNYKCFKLETGFEVIQRVNLIIGKNNVGKSSLLDVIEIVTEGTYDFDQATWREGQKPQVIFKAKIDEQVVSQTFSSSRSGGNISDNHGNYGQRFIGREITWSKIGNAANQVLFIGCDDENITPPLQDSGESYPKILSSKMPNPLEGKIFRRILAERDIVPESAGGNSVGSIIIEPNGRGLTNAIQCFINSSSLPSHLVEIDILEAMNEIFAHDAVFTDIVCQLHSTGSWEIYLEEEGKGRIALSKSGSGIKTVITVLANLFLIPQLENENLNQYIFGFEELENNIHPALLRRLNDYIYSSSIENDFIYFLTTHSNVLIDVVN